MRSLSELIFFQKKTRSLSELPDHIISHIFSLANLTNKDAIQTSLLSKDLFRALRNRPALAFDSGREAELHYIHSTLNRYHDDGIPLHTFTFNIEKYASISDINLQNQCITLAAKTRIRELSLCVRVHCNRIGLLPQSVFQVESLEKLSLVNNFLEPRGNILWPNLRRLSLYHVKMSTEDFENMIRGSPLIENLEIIRCTDEHGINFKVSNLRNLKQLNVGLFGNQTFEVNDAPNLVSITCRCHYYKKVWQNPIKNIGSHEYQNLRILSLNCVRVNEEHFINFGHRFPRLEDLSIRYSEGLEKLDISSLSLKRIRIEYIGKLQEARFDVPNIVLFEYSMGCDSIPKLSFSGNSGGWISRIKWSYIHRGLLKLNEFLTALNMSNISIIFSFPLEYFFIPTTAFSEWILPSVSPTEMRRGIHDIRIENRGGCEYLLVEQSWTPSSGFVALKQSERFHASLKKKISIRFSTWYNIKFFTLLVVLFLFSSFVIPISN